MSEHTQAEAGSPRSDAERPGSRIDRVLALSVRLAQDGASAERLEQLTAALRLELLDLGVEEARPAREGRAPAGTKAGETMTVGMLLVILAGSPVLEEVVRLVAEWVARQRTRSAILRCGERTLTLTGLSRDEQRRVVDHWLADAGG